VGAGDDDYSLYCVQPDLIEEEDGSPKDDANFTAAFNRCGYGSAHNYACKGRWAPVADHPDLPTYELVVAEPEHAFVLLGPTGDNSLRNNGVWHGLYESWLGGVWNDRLDLVNIHPTMNTPHTEESLYQGVMDSITPLYERLLADPNWSCGRVGWSSGCGPDTFWVETVQGNINIQDKAIYGRDPMQQCGTMVEDLKDYRIISVYLSIPPYAYGDWATATADSWGADRLVLAAEKPFGESTEDAQVLYDQITVDSGLPLDQLLLVDHWLSFFMLKNLPTFQEIVTDCLGIEWSSVTFSKIVVTEHEIRGLEGRGGFFDGVGQARDMFQSHLLQALGLLIIGPVDNRAEAKLEVFQDLSARTCSHGQYEDWLQEPKLGYHADFADATLSTMFLDMEMDTWKDTALEFTTGKLMGTLLYNIQMFQRDGPGVLTINYGAESIGLGDIRVSHMPVVNDACIDKNITIPKPGFSDDKVMDFIPIVDEKETMLVSYNMSAIYFPSAYAVMLGLMISESYDKGFVSYPEVHQSWEVITAGDVGICLDPPGGATMVYTPPENCGNIPPEVCYTDETVQDLYDGKYECTEENNEEWKCLNFYQDKCGLAWDPPECSGWTRPGVTINVNILTDDRPHETSWTLVDACPGGGVVATGVGYSEANEHVLVNVSGRNSRYLFSILDTGNDGICCKHGRGSYEVSIEYALQIEGGEFGTSDQQFFGLAECPTAMPPTPIPTQTPTLSPTTPNPSVAIQVFFDDFPEDISWELYDTCNGPAGVKIAEGRGYGQEYANQGVTAFVDRHIDDGKFVFVIKDSFGDGLCCSHGDGKYDIYYNDEKIITSNFEMSSEESKEFGSSDNCPPGDGSRASYDLTLGAPACDTVSASGTCTTVGTGLLVAKTVLGEPNGPNTLDACTDGRDGQYKLDESNEAITITSTSGVLAVGGNVKVTAHVFAFGNPEVEDVVDFYHASDPSNPVWKYISTVKPLVPGFSDVMSGEFALSDTETQAVRVVVRWNRAGSVTEPVPCAVGEYNDIDDLVFAVDVDPLGIVLSAASPLEMPLPLTMVQVVECDGYAQGRCSAANDCEWNGDSCHLS